jgi:hypothetical protein
MCAVLELVAPDDFGPRCDLDVIWINAGQTVVLPLLPLSKL